ncbi:probable ATP-dependent RNA helicase DDX60, partial [Limulus polyphemus]|uniref:Probable ATP-dependent RNA helicase DDX60 n=1 Tax=Limulus polyphemus TaxID=6850 RepID=A0ABM1RYC2_LIMPO
GNETSTLGSSTINSGKLKCLKEIFASFHIEYLDLRNHFSDVRQFLIDGEGLFIEFLLHPDLSWEFGGQPLHLVYLFERFLYMFLEKEANFKLLFFKSFDKVWTSVPSVALARLLLIEHFQRNTNITIIDEFIDVFDPMFEQYLIDESPSFILSSDRSSDLIKNLDEIFLIGRLKYLSLGCSYAFIDGIEFDVREVKGYFCNSETRHQRLYKLYERKICKGSCLQNIYRNLFLSTYQTLPLVPEPLQDLNNFDNKDVRVLLTCQALSNVMKIKSNMVFFIQVYALHLAILVTLPLKYRAQPLRKFDRKEEKELQEFWNLMCSCLKDCLTNLVPSSSGSFSKVGDLFDGRHFVNIFYLYKKKRKLQLNDKTMLLYMVLVEGLKIDEDTLPVMGKQNIKSSTKEELSIVESKGRKMNDFIINVSSILMDQYVGDIMSSSNLLVKDINDKWVKENVLHGYDFDEITHWHCKRLLSDDYNKTKNSFLEIPPTDLFLKKKWLKQKQMYYRFMEYYGGSLEGRRHPNCKAIVVQDKGKKASKKNNKISKGAARIIQSNIDKKQNEIREREKKIVDDNLENINDLKRNKDYKGALYCVKQLLSKIVDQVIKKKLLLLSLQVLVDLMEEKLKKCNTMDPNDLVVFIEDLKVLLTDLRKELSDHDKKKISKYCFQVGLDEIIDKEGLFVNEKYQKKESFVRSIETVRFQLEHMGALLSREYRYSYEYLTRVWDKMVNSTIRVSPQCFEILLLAPHRQDWAKKIRFVIFDEIHCLDSEHAAEVWEHLILLICCPFLALSATIRNPEGLCAWLQKIEDYKQICDKRSGMLKHGREYKVALITCKERHADLINYQYIPETDYLQNVHPVSLFKVKDLQNLPRFPEHVTLSPIEVLQLYDAMKIVCPKYDELEKLEPGFEFKTKTFLTKQDCKKYEHKLKELFIRWIRTGKTTLAEKVIINLKGTSQKQQNFSFNASNISKENERHIKQYILPLLDKMKNKGKFPAIFFCYNRSLCEDLVSYVAKELKTKEDAYKQSKSMKVAEKMKKPKVKKIKRIRDKEKELKAASSCNDASERSNSIEDLVAETFENEKVNFLFENKPLQDFTYANYGVIDRKETQFLHDRLCKAFDKKDVKHFSSSLCRGISYHHGGVDIKRRRTVEMLFRNKFLNIVIATGTLALGIHMPCKTVVFLGDSEYLTPLNYCQMSGRAGRRGFDLKGEVIFFGVPPDKVVQLITADLPKLIGNFPVSVTLVLRLLLLVARSEDKQDALNRAHNLLKHPLICQNQPQLNKQLKQHFMYSVQFLLRE